MLSGCYPITSDNDSPDEPFSRSSVANSALDSEKSIPSSSLWAGRHRFGNSEGTAMEEARVLWIADCKLRCCLRLNAMVFCC